MIQLFDNIDFFFENLTTHQSQILFLFLAALLFLGFRTLKDLNQNENENNKDLRP